MKDSTRYRVIFSFMYNTDTTRVAQLTARGWSNSQIARSTGLSTGTIAAIRANLTRGSYHPFVYVDKNGRYRGACKY